MTGGAVAWLGSNLLWLGGWPVHALVPWWIGFLVLTIAGERLELSRMLFHAPWTKTLFLALVALLHGALLLRMIGDLAYIETLRTWGNAIAILLFLGATVSSVLRDAPDSHEYGAETLSHAHSSSATEAGPAQEVPDLELPASQ